MTDSHTNRIYEYLVAHPGSTQLGVSEALGLSMTEIEPSLQFLQDTHLIASSKSDDGTIIAHSPDLAIATLTSDAQKEISQLQTSVAEQKAHLVQFESIFSRAKASALQQSGYEVLESSRTINRLIDELTRETKKSLFEAHPGHGHSADTQVEGIEIDRQLRAKRVKRRTLLHASTRSHAPSIRAVRAQTEIGCQVRTLEDVPVRMFIFDDTSAIISRNAFPSDRAAIYTQDTAITNLLVQMYSHMWSQATVFEIDDLPQQELTPIQLSILKLMAAGYSDASAVKRLAISLRTYRRQVAEIMETLQAESRFQAGVVAAQRGLLR